jgi:membrane associated rhomboid family serine protease
VFAYILFNPLQKLYLYGIIGLPGIIFGGLYLLYCYFASKRQGDYVNHDAHFWGAVYGLLFTIILKPQLFYNFVNQLPFFHGAF